MHDLHDEFGTVADYYKAFQALQGKGKGIHEKHLALLNAHFDAPNHTASWAQLAKLVGYSDGDAVNLQYGTLAGRVAQQLGIQEKPKGFWLHVMVKWAKHRDPESGHTAFVLRRPVIQALTRLGILPKIERKKAAHDAVEAASPTSKVIAALLTDPQVRAEEVQLAAMEGRHYIAEGGFRRRNHALIEAKKKESDGKCSVCCFDFKERYGGIEKDHLVAHHVKPIGKRKKATKTTLADIDLLCPNCHAAVHSEDPPISADELRGRLIVASAKG
jgi:5-methylcytosine-specific restriction endonuclease McrA